MRSPLRFPIRFKILFTLLILVTAVVSIITFTMAKLFHEDKKGYIKDLASMVAVSTAEECRSVLVGYAERLRLYSRIMGSHEISRDQRTDLQEGFFEDFPQLIAVVLYEDGQELAAVYDAGVLRTAGLSKEEVRKHRAEAPLPMGRIQDGEVFVRNSTLSEKLPSLTLALAHSIDRERPPVVVSALIRLDGLLRLAGRPSAFEVSLVDVDGILLAHPDAERVAQRAAAEPGVQITEVQDEHSAAMTTEYVLDGTEMFGGFAPVGFGGVTATAQIPRSAAYLASRAFLDRLIGVALVLLVLAAFGGLFWARRVTRPVERLSSATRKIARGEFDIRIQVTSRDELGALAGSFNQMASELTAREKALREAQTQLVQSEKMAAFGQLGAGIAHEVKNPLAGILGCAQLSLRKADREGTIHKNLKLIEKETKRCKMIIDNLLKFSRKEQAAFAAVEINRVVEDASAIVNHQLELRQVKQVKELAQDLPRIHGNANQLQQVLMNLIMNAQQAMDSEPGLVTIATRRLDATHIEVRVSDTGPGIPIEIQDKLFEPFFTTKPAGKGTGLGLSVSYGIIRDHGGEIAIESEPGQGAAFIITLPILQDASLQESCNEQRDELVCA